jgi:hypothetical protein
MGTRRRAQKTRMACRSFSGTLFSGTWTSLTSAFSAAPGGPGGHR